MADFTIAGVVQGRCLYVGGSGRIEFQLDNGYVATIGCDVAKGKDDFLVFVEPSVVPLPDVDTSTPVADEAPKPKSKARK